MCLQPEQVPFSLSDIWRWLVRTVNVLSQTEGKFLFFTATILEITLKISAKKLFEVYGESFFQLVSHINKEILPKIPADMSKRANLEDFLQKFIRSNGKEYVSFFLVK